ncbi:hypothetical protein Pelo_17755, partial [Pelomyxa schiedti]
MYPPTGTGGSAISKISNTVLGLLSETETVATAGAVFTGLLMTALHTPIAEGSFGLFTSQTSCVSFLMIQNNDSVALCRLMQPLVIATESPFPRIQWISSFSNGDASFLIAAMMTLVPSIFFINKMGDTIQSFRGTSKDSTRCRVRDSPSQVDLARSNTLNIVEPVHCPLGTRSAITSSSAPENAPARISAPCSAEYSVTTGTVPSCRIRLCKSATATVLPASLLSPVGHTSHFPFVNGYRHPGTSSHPLLAPLLLLLLVSWVMFLKWYGAGSIPITLGGATRQWVEPTQRHESWGGHSLTPRPIIETLPRSGENRSGTSTWACSLERDSAVMSTADTAPSTAHDSQRDLMNGSSRDSATRDGAHPRPHRGWLDPISARNCA